MEAVLPVTFHHLPYLAAGKVHSILLLDSLQDFANLKNQLVKVKFPRQKHRFQTIRLLVLSHRDVVLT